MRGRRKRADYLLFHTAHFPIAVVEAKDKSHAVGAGLQQAIRYAEILDLPFAFASNGDAFVVHDRTGQSAPIERTLTLDEFPSPDELWGRYRVRGLPGPVPGRHRLRGGEAGLSSVLARFLRPRRGRRVPSRQRAWRVGIEQIQARGFNLDFKNPHKIDAEHQDPDALLEGYRQARASAAEAREQLKKALSEALLRDG